MNERRLDSLARNLALARSRRGVLKAVAAVFVGSLLGSRASAPQADAQTGACGGPGQPCCLYGINATTLSACTGGAVCQSQNPSIVPPSNYFPGPSNQYICVCPGGTVQKNGACVCPPGMVKRHGACVCPDGMVRQNDACVCPTGQVNCNGKCQHCCTATDCKDVAHATPTCSSGTCRYTCDAGYRKCGGHCTPVTTPCNGNCPSTRTLVNGVCAKKCTPGSQCSCGTCLPLMDGQFVCSGATVQGTCVSTATCAP